MRFHTAHLMVLVGVAAFVFALLRYPEALWAAVIPLIGGLFVVFPVLGTVEWMVSRSSNSEIGWRGGCLICTIGVLGASLAIVLLSALIDLMP